MRIHKIFRTPIKNTVLLLSEAKINVVQLLIHVLLFRPGDCSMPGFLFLHYLLEFAQTLVLWVGDTTQSSHLLSTPSLPTLNLSQHWGLFQWILQFNSVAQSCPTLCDPMNHSTPALPVHHQLRSSLKLMSIESVMPSSHLILCRPLLLLPPIPPSIKVFSNESTLRMRWPKYWSFSFSIFPSKEHPRLISFRMDWLGFLAVKGTLKSLLQHHSSKASILWALSFLHSPTLTSIHDHRKNHSLD